MAGWEELDCLERAVLCNLWRLAPRTGRKPANIPLEALLRGLDPAIRDSALVREAVRSLARRGLVEWYRKRKRRTLTITPEGSGWPGSTAPRSGRAYEQARARMARRLIPREFLGQTNPGSPGGASGVASAPPAASPRRGVGACLSPRGVSRGPLFSRVA